MSNYRIEHNIPKGPEKINNYNKYDSPYDYYYQDGELGCEQNQILVRGYIKKDGTRVESYCRDMTKKELKDIKAE